MTEDLVKMCRRLSKYAHAQLSAADLERIADRIEKLETKLAESEARSEVLETLVMDVAADLYDGVPAHKIDQRIMDAIRQLDEEEEED